MTAIPRDSQSNYSLPQGYKAVTGQKVLASQHNPPLEDIAAALTDSLARNGTGPMTGDLPMGGFRITGMASAVNDGDAATKAQMDSLIPAGCMMAFAGPNAPQGWLFCYGQELSRSTYASLFSAIGTRFGAGNGSTTFNAPDLRGRVIAGKDDMGGTAAGRLTGAVTGVTLGAAGGESAHTLSYAEMPSHSHSSGGLSASSAGNHNHVFNIWAGDGGRTDGAGGNGVSSVSGSSATAFAGAHTHTITGSTAAAGSDNSHNNLQPTLVANWIIKT